MAAPSIEMLEQLLRNLRQRDQTFAVFGADTHRYRSSPVPDGELSKFEGLLGVRLPDDFREFLLRIGSGAGPAYGILSPLAMLEEQGFWLDESFAARAERRVCGNANPARSFHATLDELELADSRVPDGPYVAVPEGPDGIVKICHRGCTVWNVLITAGPLRGGVLSYCDSAREVVPTTRGPTQQVGATGSGRRSLETFSEWYESWLRCSLAEL